MRPRACPRCGSAAVQFCRWSINLADFPRWLCRDCLVVKLILDETEDRMRRAQARARGEYCFQRSPRRRSALDSAILSSRRARRTSTLTMEQWAAVVAFFGDGCAYCGGPWFVVEHVTPTSRGGGTTVANCLPACVGCNSSKRNRTIEECLADDFWPHRTARVERALSWLTQQGRPIATDLDRAAGRGSIAGMPDVIVFTDPQYPPGAVTEAPAPTIAQVTYATSMNPADKPNGPDVVFLPLGTPATSTPPID